MRNENARNGQAVQRNLFHMSLRSTHLINRDQYCVVGGKIWEGSVV